ncbi:Bcr/CflA subfamily drug resistance transporter [Phycicoccus sp. Soil802]|nr:Bcr/CflA subfamily drug resistance transporter [Phycicoccus sp. Soil802]
METTPPLVDPGPVTSSATVAVGRGVPAILALLTVLGPASMDLYLPVLPALARDVEASTSSAQLTMTTCLLGLALGQVVAGPVSDRYGRRRPLIAGLVVFMVASALCVFSSSVGMLIALRFVQGLAGAVGLVIAQAAGRDIYVGRQLTRYYGRIVVLSGLAAIVAPVVGGQLATLLAWRGFFVVLTAIGGLVLLAVILGFRESLPVALRVSGGARSTGGHVRTLLGDRVFLGAMLASAFTAAAYFGYLAGASFVLQDVYALPPATYSLVFGLNAAGFAGFGFLGGRLAEHWSERLAFIVGLGIMAAGAGGLLATAVTHLPLPCAIASFFAVAAGAAAVSPPATSLALADYPQFAGTASSILGVTRFAAGALTAPLVGLGGSMTLVPLGIVTVASVGLAVAAYVWFVHRAVA